MSQQLITANEVSPTSGVANTGIVGLITSAQLQPNLVFSGTTTMSGNLVVQGTTTTVNQEIVNTSIITSTSVSSPILNGPSTLALQTANTNALYINSNQQVGIGTSSPAINSGLNNTLTVFNSAGGYGSIEIYGNTSTQGGILDFGAATVRYVNLAGEYDGATNKGRLVFRINDGSAASAAIERMRIDSSGNLLVGGTSQLTSSKLSVYGSAAVYNGGVDGTFAEGLNFVYNGNTAQYSTIKNSMSSIANSAGLQFWLGGAGSGNTQWLGYNLTRGQQQWYTNNSLAMTLNTSGQLGIGKTPSYPLHVNGTAAATAFLTGDIIMDNTDESLAPNEVDGTRGHWVLQEGDVNLFLINRITGKKYKFNITEVGE